jgi:hypothetical protein
MANPNIAAATSIIGDTYFADLSTASSILITVPSNTVYKINTISVCNKTASSITATVQPSFVPFVGGKEIVKDIAVPGNTTLVVVSKETSFYLLETGSIRANVSANSSANILISYEAIS